MLPLSWEREVSAMEAVSVCFRGILLIKNRISTGFPLPIRSTGFSLSLSEICFYALIKLNYFSLSVHSLLELGKTKTRKRTAHHCFFSPLLSIQTQKIHCGFLRPDSRLWIIFCSILIFSSEHRSHPLTGLCITTLPLVHPPTARPAPLRLVQWW